MRKTLVQTLIAAFCAILCAGLSPLSALGGGGMMIGARTAAWASNKEEEMYKELFLSFVARTTTEINDENIITVGRDAITFFSNLTTVNLPNATSIGYSGINNNINLVNLNLPKVSSISTFGIGSNTKLEVVNLPSVTGRLYMNNYFFDMKKLHTFRAEKATSFEEGFNGCPLLRTIEVNSMNAQDVVSNFNSRASRGFVNDSVQAKPYIEIICGDGSCKFDEESNLWYIV